MLRNKATLNQENLAPATAIKNRDAFATPAPPANARRTALAAKSTNAKPRADLNDKLDDYGKAHLPPAPLQDDPLDYNIDESYPQFRRENIFRGFAEIYYRNDEEDEARRRKQREDDEREYERSQRELEILMEQDLLQQQPLYDSDEAEAKPRHEKHKDTTRTSTARPTAKRGTSAAPILKLDRSKTALTSKHTRLPSAAMRQTASSRSKQKSSFTVARDEAGSGPSGKASEANHKSKFSISRHPPVEKIATLPAVETLRLEEEDDPSLYVGEINVDMGIDIDTFEL